MKKIIFNLEEELATTFKKVRAKLGCQRDLPLIIKAMLLHQKDKEEKKKAQ